MPTTFIDGSDIGRDAIRSVNLSYQMYGSGDCRVAVATNVDTQGLFEFIQAQINVWMLTADADKIAAAGGISLTPGGPSGWLGRNTAERIRRVFSQESLFIFQLTPDDLGAHAKEYAIELMLINGKTTADIFAQLAVPTRQEVLDWNAKRCGGGAPVDDGPSKPGPLDKDTGRPKRGRTALFVVGALLGIAVLLKGR